jgi:hypothetical protein
MKMTKEQEIFLIAFRTAEAIYKPASQPVKSQAEILAEMPFSLTQ